MDSISRLISARCQLDSSGSSSSVGSSGLGMTGGSFRPGIASSCTLSVIGDLPVSGLYNVLHQFPQRMIDRRLRLLDARDVRGWHDKEILKRTLLCERRATSPVVTDQGDGAQPEAPGRHEGGDNVRGIPASRDADGDISRAAEGDQLANKDIL